MKKFSSILKSFSNKSKNVVVDNDLLEESFFDSLESNFNSILPGILSDFVDDSGNKDVYALILDIDPDTGIVCFNMNNLESLKEIISKEYADYSTDQIEGFRGLKYSADDFGMKYFLNVKMYGELCDLLYKYHYAMTRSRGVSSSDTVKYREKFMEVCFSVLNNLDMSTLNKTPDFIYYVHEADSNEDQILNNMTKTISTDKINEVFPKLG